MIEALVFDLDGTIVDTEGTEYESVRRVWEEHGRAFPPERWVHVIGNAWAPTWVEELADELGHPLEAAAVRARQRAHNAELRRDLRPRPGVIELIDAADAARIPLAIASNSDRRWVDHRLADLGLSGRFASIASIDDVAQGKPDPEPFVAACVAVGATPRHAVAFEDSATGVRAAVAAGCYTVACPVPLTTGHDLSPAHRRVASLTEVTLAELADAVAARAGGGEAAQPS
jgi:HAD superfamily hydrolase (TIGR01509 family)